MSKKIGNKLYLEEEAAQKCEYCGKVAELRPYSKNGANICFKCAMKDEKTAKDMFAKRINGVNTVIVVDKSRS